MSAPRLWYVTRFLPRCWRLALLEALAWPEFEVGRLWYSAPEDGAPTVSRIPLRHTSAAEAFDRLWLDGSPS